MRRFIWLILITVFVSNFAAIFIYFKRCEFCWNINSLMEFHAMVSIYALKGGVIFAIVDRITGGKKFIKKN